MVLRDQMQYKKQQTQELEIKAIKPQQRPIWVLLPTRNIGKLMFYARPALQMETALKFVA